LPSSSGNVSKYSSSLFSNSTIAKLVGFLGFYFIAMVPVSTVRTYMATALTKQLVSLVPQAAFFLALETFTRAEVLSSLLP
jgi:hypothetical protein